MKRGAKSILILTNDQPLADTLQRIVRVAIADAAVKTSTYAKTAGLLSARLADTDIFILGLFRQYAGGLRAEGVALAGLLVPRGKKVLVVSPLHLPSLAKNDAYWDTASGRLLSARLSQMASLSSQRADIAELNRVFDPLLRIPPQH